MRDVVSYHIDRSLLSCPFSWGDSWFLVSENLSIAQHSPCDAVVLGGLCGGHGCHLIDTSAKYGQFAIHITHCVNAVNVPPLRYIINIIGEIQLAQLADDIIKLYID